MKAFWKSKTFWFNVLSAVGTVTNTIPVEPVTAGVLTAITNIGLRFVTKEPVKLIGKPEGPFKKD